MRQWEGRCSLPCKEEQIKLTSQGVSQTQAYQAWVHCVSVDNGEQRSKDNQKTKRQKNVLQIIRKFRVWNMYLAKPSSLQKSQELEATSG